MAPEHWRSREQGCVRLWTTGHSLHIGRVSASVGYSVAFLAIALSLVPQVLIVGDVDWKVILVCPAVFFGLLGVFGLVQPLVLSRSRAAYRDADPMPVIAAVLGGVAVFGAAMATAALSLDSGRMRTALALLAGAMTAVAVIGLGSAIRGGTRH